jgi:hydrogenase nickel incorporation protein HypB
VTERVKVVERILGANDRLADENRKRLDVAGVASVNLMASPGAGKTSLVERTVAALRGELAIGMINGDLATSLDADRAASVGAVAVQINTGGQCHLDAAMVQGALDRLDLAALDLLLVENVGNLICPTGFALGTHKNVVVASVPEGDDKPYKYPGSYRGVHCLVLNKIDLLPYVPFDLGRFLAGVQALNPGVTALPLSCATGEGVDAWLDWVRAVVLADLAQA